LNTALASDDASTVLRTIGEMIHAQGVREFSKKSYSGCIYRSFSGRMSPRFDRVLDALSALDVRLVVVANSTGK
jgi:DNA-binding phage protein